MDKILELLIKTIELHTQTKFLKKIDRANDKAFKLREKTIRQNQRVRVMVRIYNEMYKDDPITLKKFSAEYEVK